MKKIILMLLCWLTTGETSVFAQERKCGAQVVKEILTARDPSYESNSIHRREHLSAQTRLYEENLSKVKSKTTTVVKIPIVFHVVLNTNQINTLGGINGIRQRAISQVNALTKDFNKQNTDLGLVPAAFQPLIGNMEIQFGLAHRKPNGTSTEGFEIVTTTASSYSIADLATGAKHASSGGADIWDPSRYLNVWVVNLGSGGILGFTLVPQPVPSSEDGVVLTYGAFGVRSGATDYYLGGIDRGRTLTHEIGHFIALDHIWGDDGGLCPGNGGQDDAVSDTPPQADYTYNSNFTGGNIPFPLTDNCSSGNGIMWMNFLDYVNDAWMYMFTNGQVSRARTALAVGPYPLSLTQHPELLDWPTDVTEIEKTSGFNVFPNPSSGNFTISFDDATGLQEINIINVIGQNVHSIKAGNPGISNYNADLTGLSKGVYMVQCTFAQGTVSRKIVLQ